MSDDILVRNWNAIVHDSRVDLHGVWADAIFQIASKSAIEKREAWEKDPSGAEPPIVEVNPETPPIELLETPAKRPSWWPTQLRRLAVRIEALDLEGIQESSQPTTIETSSTDTGRNQFINAVERQLNNFPTPFEGRVSIIITDMTRAPVAKKHINCGVNVKGKKGRGGDREDPSREFIDYLKGQNNDFVKGYAQNQSGTAAVLHGAAAVVNATRGVNAAPPWAQGGEGEPLWMKVGLEVLKIAMPGLGAGAEGVKNLIRGPEGAMPYTPTPPQIGLMRDFDPAGPPPQDVGLYDGVEVGEDVHVLEPEWDNADAMTPSEDAVEIGDEEPGVQEAAPTNPLEGMSPEQLSAYLEDYIDRTPDKSKIRTMGMNLARKIL